MRYMHEHTIHLQPYGTNGYAIEFLTCLVFGVMLNLRQISVGISDMLDLPFQLENWAFRRIEPRYAALQAELEQCILREHGNGVLSSIGALLNPYNAMAWFDWLTVWGPQTLPRGSAPLLLAAGCDGSYSVYPYAPIDDKPAASILRADTGASPLAGMISYFKLDAEAAAVYDLIARRPLDEVFRLTSVPGNALPHGYVSGHVGLSERPLGYGAHVPQHPPTWVLDLLEECVRALEASGTRCVWPALSLLHKYRSYPQGCPACLSGNPYGLACQPSESVGLPSA